MRNFWIELQPLQLKERIYEIPMVFANYLYMTIWALIKTLRVPSPNSLHFQVGPLFQKVLTNLNWLMR